MKMGNGSFVDSIVNVGRAIASFRNGVADEREAMLRSIERRERASGVPDLAPFLTTVPTYPPSDFSSIISHGFRKNELVLSGLRQITQLFAQARAEVHDSNDNVINAHPMVDVLRDPSTEYGTPRSFEYELWEWTLLDMYLCGNCFWEKLFARSGRLVGVKRLQPHRMGILPNSQTGVAQYFYEGGDGTWLPLDSKRVLHWRFPNPSTDPLEQYFGMSPLLTAFRVICTDNEMTDFTKTVLQNYAIPGVAIETQQNVDPKTAEEIKRTFRERYGKGRRGDPAVLQRGMTLKTVGMNMNELAFDKLRMSTETRILMVLGGAALVYLCGAQAGMERHTFANYAEARESLADDVVAPLWSRFSDCLTMNFLTDFEGRSNPRKYSVQFNTDRVIAFDNRRVQRIEIATKAFTSGVLTRDQSRRMIGYDPLGGPDVVCSPVNLYMYEVGPGGKLTLISNQPEQSSVEQPSSIQPDGDKEPVVDYAGDGG